MKSIQVDELLRFAQGALEAAGVGAENARTIANTLVTTDTFGVFSHGTNNLYNYIRKMQAGRSGREGRPDGGKGRTLVGHRQRQCGHGYGLVLQGHGARHRKGEEDRHRLCRRAQ